MAMQSSNVLVLGLGGSGLKVATYVMKGVMEANNNSLPSGFSVLVADTEEEVKFKAGGWGNERGKNHATGPVRITKGRYLPLTGNVKELAVKVMREQKEGRSNPAIRSRQPNRHITSWFQAQHYIEDVNVDNAVWNLDVGAGQYRQFGRIGLFNHVSTRIARMLTSAIGSLKRSGQNNFQVHIVGSFAGGTGAAMFIDFPHLIKAIAREAGFNQSPTIIGHFLLANAFSGTRNIGLNKDLTRRAFDARTYACLRELTRLQGVSLQRAGGYPIVYDPAGAGKLNGKMAQSPYTYVYLYDGERPRNPLNTLELPDGIAPSIADVIMAYVDSKSSAAFRSHTVNFKAYYGSHDIPTGQVTYGSVGTYTIELPIYHIVEGWSHELARDLLDIVLNPVRDASGNVDLSDGTLNLIDDMPAGKRREPDKEALRWAQESGLSGLVGKLINWGQRAKRTTTLHGETAREILSYDANTWQQDLAPAGAEFQDYVAEAQDDLRGSFTDKTSRYFVDFNQAGNSAASKGSNLVVEIDSQMVAMVGRTESGWKRDGGNFRGSLIRLANHHRKMFEDAIVEELRLILNGGTGGSATEKKQGKLAYAMAFISELQAIMQQAQTLLQDASGMAARERRDTYLLLEQDLKTASEGMNRKSGFMGGNLRRYRDLADDIAQFHKADIARQVVYDLVGRLITSINQLHSELRRWITILAEATSEYGGTYSLLLEGIEEVAADRKQSRNAARWQIADDEPRDTYIAQRRQKYRSDNFDTLLEQINWNIGVTAEGEMRVAFNVMGQPFDKRAGQRNERPLGLKNLNQLLTACREVFEPAWTDMTVTEYLYHNFDEREKELAQRIYQRSGYLLAIDGNEPPMRSIYMRVYKEGMSGGVRQFLEELLGDLRVEFGDETSDSFRNEVAKGRASKEYDNEGEQDRLSSDGQDSHDPFKMSFIIFGDLLQPEKIIGYKGAQERYRQYSNTGNKWKELQILPAETNALQIERSLNGSRGMGQRRRELSEEVVTLLENMSQFRLAMRCLAYGEGDYRWDDGGRGLLLYQYTDPNSSMGYRYWRLTVMPEGRLAPDGKVYAGTTLAQPLHYQLSDADANPDLWQAMLQLVVTRTDKSNNNAIDLSRVQRTIEFAQRTHLGKWEDGKKLGWQWKIGKPFDAELNAEGLDKAAKVARLNAFSAELLAQLEDDTWKWAWESTENESIPAHISSNRDLVNRIRRAVDLRTALHWAAQDERSSLNIRLKQLGSWQGGEPKEMLLLSTHTPEVAPVPEPPLTVADDQWECPSCGRHNDTAKKFCGSCGTPKPVAPPVQEPVVEVVTPIVEPVTTLETLSAEQQAQIDQAQNLFNGGVINQTQFDAMMQKIRGVADELSAEQQAQIDQAQSLLDAKIIDQAQFDAMVAKIYAQNATPQLSAEQQAQIDQAQSLLDAKIIDQAQFEAMIAKIKDS